MNVVQQYKTWVRNNSNLLGAIEGGLSSLTWLLPDRFSDSELNLEALNSLLGLLGLFHESILQEPVYQQNGKQPAQWPLWLGAVQQVFLKQARWIATQIGHSQSLQHGCTGGSAGGDGCTQPGTQGCNEPVYPTLTAGSTQVSNCMR